MPDRLSYRKINIVRQDGVLKGFLKYAFGTNQQLKPGTLIDYESAVPDFIAFIGEFDRLKEKFPSLKREQIMSLALAKSCVSFPWGWTIQKSLIYYRTSTECYVASFLLEVT